MLEINPNLTLVVAAVHKLAGTRRSYGQPGDVRGELVE